MIRRLDAVTALVASLLSACAAVPGAVQQDAASIPLHLADGTAVSLAGRVCRPQGTGPARVVVIAHGSPPLASQRPSSSMQPCSGEAVRWFTDRGYLVVQSLRRGYGATGGAYAEASTDCRAASYEHAARASAEDVQATVDYALALPGARPDGAVVVGQSAGGWAAVGLDAAPHPGVIALVSMAGGRGGHAGNRPYNNCKPENLVTAAGRLGATASTPMLWVYTANDSYFGPDLARDLHAAFTEAGGKAELHALPLFGKDGHNLFFGRGGSAVWGPVLEPYLRARGA